MTVEIIRDKQGLDKLTTHWESDTFCTGVHSLHVHIRPEQSHLPLRVDVGFHALEDGLRIMQDGGARLKQEGAVWKRRIRACKSASWWATGRATYMAQSLEYPIHPRPSRGR